MVQQKETRDNNENGSVVAKESSPPVTLSNTPSNDQTRELDEALNATWGEVFTSCCVHTPKEWGWIAFGLFLVAFFLYFFLVALDVLGSGAKVMTGCQAGTLFGSDANPVAGVMVGILATVLLQSSSTTTSIIVSLVGSAISTEQGIYMVMGANIGTSVTNTIVAMGQMGDGDELERAFAGATVHDLFNFLTVAILLPLEAATGYLAKLTGAMVKNVNLSKGETWDGPIKAIVSPIGDLIIKANNNIITAVANGSKTCASYYPIVCEDGIQSAKTCKVALIACDKQTNKCPVFFSQDATQSDEVVAGAVCFVLSVMLLFVCLLGLVTVLKKMLLGASSRIIYKATNLNGYASMAIGAGLTMLVQSSSITTSVLTPLVGIGVLPLEAMYPLTLGANIGTTVTALLASMVSDNVASLQVALAHLMFNVTGTLIFYPVPFMRRIPLAGARTLGRITRIWRGFPLAYIGVVFFFIPIMLLGISTLYVQGTLAWTVLAVVFTLLVLGGVAWTIFWCKFQDGKKKMAAKLQKRQRKSEALQSLPDDMETLKRKVQILMDLTGASDDDDDNDDVEKQALLEKEVPTENMKEKVDSTDDDEIPAEFLTVTA